MKKIEEAFKLVKSADFYKLLGLGLLFGALASLIMVGLFHLVDFSIELVWEVIPHHLHNLSLPLYTLLVALVGSVLIGLGHRFFGDYPESLEESMERFNKEGSFDYKHLPQGFAIGITSLAFGGSLGPEAVMISLIGGIESWLALKVSHLVDLDALPWPKREENSKAWLAIPAVTALIGMVLVMMVLGMPSFMSIDYGSFSFGFTDYLLAIPLALVALLAGLLYKKSYNVFKTTFRPLESRPVVRALIGGLGVGIMGALLPLTLFSGQRALGEIYTNAAEYGAVILLAVGLINIFLTALCLNTGWKGGQFFPILFSGAAIGLALGLLLPGIHPLAALVAGVTGLTYGATGSEKMTVMIVALLFPLKSVGVSLAAALICVGAVKLWAALQTKHAAPVAQFPPTSSSD